jgi:EAL and modified HD-GYP domain-containing signal transduction protein
MNALFDLGLDRIAGNVPVFVNIPEDLLAHRVAEILPADRCILEILEDVVFREDIVGKLAQLRGAGYRLALDDFVYTEDKSRILEMADIVKLDLRALDSATLVENVKRIKRPGVELLAEKIETQAEFRFCKDLGFDYFQGYFLSRPEVIPGKRTPVDLPTIVLVLEKCRNPLSGVQAIAGLVSQNATLAYRLLQSANSAFHNRRKEITSVDEAVLFLGTEFVSRLASLFLLAGLSARPSCCLLIALQRACMCEILADSVPDTDRNELYLAGLLSALDILLDQPIGEIIPPLPLAESVKNAIVERSGPIGLILRGVMAYEVGDWQNVLSAGLNPRKVSNAYWQAAPRVDDLRTLFECPAKPCCRRS